METSEPRLPLYRRLRVSRKAIYLVVGLVFLAGVAYGIYTLANNNTSVGTIVPERVAALFGRDNNDESEWQMYTNDDYGYSIKYPQETELSEQPDGSIFLIQEGTSQNGNGEFTDGISVEIAVGKLEDRSLQAVVDGVVEEIAGTPNLEVVREPELFTIGSRAGYKFEVAGVNSFTYMYIPVGMESYLEIVDATQDPENKGYKSDVDQIVTSVEFLSPPQGL